MDHVGLLLKCCCVYFSHPYKTGSTVPMGGFSFVLIFVIFALGCNQKEKAGI